MIATTCFKFFGIVRNWHKNNKLDTVTVIYHFEKITFNTFEETQGKPSLLALSSTYLDIGTADHRNKTLHKGVNPPPATHLHSIIRQLLKIFRGGPIMVPSQIISIQFSRGSFHGPHSTAAVAGENCRAGNESSRSFTSSFLVGSA